MHIDNRYAKLISCKEYFLVVSTTSPLQELMTLNEEYYSNLIFKFSPIPSNHYELCLFAICFEIYFCLLLVLLIFIYNPVYVVFYAKLLCCCLKKWLLFVYSVFYL